MSAKTSEARRRAFFAALAATGNQTIAAERARVSRSWIQLQRTRDPAFRQAVEEAVAAAKAHLRDGDGIAPPTGWGSLDGEELMVRGTNGRRVQVARARQHEFSPRVEARFLAVVAATCNVKAACAVIGMSPTGVYAHRRRRRDFADRWDRAIETGYLRLEMGLLERCGSLFAGDLIEHGAEDALVTGQITVDQAMRLWFHHRQRVHGIGRKRTRAEVTGDVAVVEVRRRVAVMKRAQEVPVAEMARARDEWAARRLGG